MARFVLGPPLEEEEKKPPRYVLGGFDETQPQEQKSPRFVLGGPGIDEPQEQQQLSVLRPGIAATEPGPSPLAQVGSFAKKHLLDEPAKGAEVLREAIAEKIAPSEFELEQKAKETGDVSYLDIAKTTGAETLAELIPMTPTDVALFGALGAGQKLAGTGVKALASRFPAVAFAERAAKTPLSRLPGRFRARARFGPGTHASAGITPATPPAPVRPRPLIRPGEVIPPKEPVRLAEVNPREGFGPIIKPGEEHLHMATEKNILGPLDDVIDPAERFMLAKRLDKSAANTVEPITPVEGPTVLFEKQAQGGPGYIFQREFTDRMIPIRSIPTKGIDPAFEQAGGGYTKSYVAARMLKGKTRGKSELILDRVNQIVEPLRGSKDRQLLNEIYTMRNFRDLDLIGRTTSGVTAKDAIADLERIRLRIGDKKFNQISRVADKLADIQNNDALEILIDGKVITRKTADELRTRFPNYLRSEVLEENLKHIYPQFVAADGEAMSRINRGFLKTKRGTEKMINTDVLDVVRRSLISKIAAAEKQKVVDLVAHEFGVPIGKRFLGKGPRVKTSSGQMIKGSWKTKTSLDHKQIVDVFEKDKVPPGWDRTTIQPSDRTIVAVNPEIAKMMQGLHVEEADFITKAMSKYNNLFRLGATTYRLPFVISNIARDIQTMLFNKRVVPGQKSLAVALPEGFISAVKSGFGIKNKVYQDFLDSGAAFGGLATQFTKNIKLPFRLRRPTEKMLDVARETVLLPFEEIARLAQISENIPRLTEFIRLRNTGMSRELRALNARDLTVDFEKFGNSLRLANRWIPFLNAQVQGYLNTGRAFAAQPLTSVARFGYLVGAPAVGLYAWNRNFKNNDRIDPYIKENYWYLNTGAEIEREGQQVPILITIRKGEAARDMALPIELFLEWSENDPSFDARMKEYDKKNLASAFAARITPPAFSAGFEQIANWDVFRRRQIIPRSLEDVESGSQFKTYTSNTARLIGEKTGVSPARLEHLARGVFPATPMLFEAGDVALNSLGILPKVPRKPKEALRALESMVPLVRAPSGYFSPEESASREFQAAHRTEVRTPAFLFEEAFKLSLQAPTPENENRAQELAEAVPGDTRKRIIKKVRRAEIMRSFAPVDKATQRLPLKLRGRFQDQMQQSQRGF